MTTTEKTTAKKNSSKKTTTKKPTRTKKPKISLTPLDVPMPSAPSAPDEALAVLEPYEICHAVAANGRVVGLVGDKWPFQLAWLDPGAAAPTVVEGLSCDHGIPRISPDGSRVLLHKKATKQILEVSLDSGETREAYGYGQATFIKADYVSDDTITFLWGASELWTLYRQGDGSYEPGEVLGVSTALDVHPFLGKFALLDPDPEKKRSKHVIVGFRGTNIGVLGELELDRHPDLTLLDGRAVVSKDGQPHLIEGLEECWAALPDRFPLSAAPYTGHLPTTAEPPRYRQVFTESQSLIGVTPEGRILGWVAGDLVWLDLDDTRHPVAMEGKSHGIGTGHPTQDRVLVPSGATGTGRLPWDIGFPPRARLLWNAADVSAVYASDDRIAVVADETLHILADDPNGDGPLEVIASLPCPSHNAVFSLRYGRSVLTSGPDGCGVAPKMFEIAGEPTLRGEVPATSAAHKVLGRDYRALLKKQGGAISNVRDVVYTHGRYFIRTHGLGNYEVCGVEA